jgi:serine/threonine protein phosphatase PrpC
VKGKLQPTRSLGDYYLKYNEYYKGKGTFRGPYIISEPDIKIFTITSNFRNIIVASDGVWDYINKDIVVVSSLKPNPHE